MDTVLSMTHTREQLKYDVRLYMDGGENGWKVVYFAAHGQMPTWEYIKQVRKEVDRKRRFWPSTLFRRFIEWIT